MELIITIERTCGAYKIEAYKIVDEWYECYDWLYCVWLEYDKNDGDLFWPLDKDGDNSGNRQIVPPCAIQCFSPTLYNPVLNLEFTKHMTKE